MPALGSRQAELYAAEESIAGAGVRWRRVAEVQAYLDRLLESTWFFDRWPQFVRCTVERRGSGSRWSTCQHLDAAGGTDQVASEGVILLASGGLSQPIVLHELAHLLLPRSAGHQRAFAETLLTLVRHEMGFVAFADLYQALRTTEGFRMIGEGIATATH